jgi:hypothetical protein
LEHDPHKKFLFIGEKITYHSEPSFKHGEYKESLSVGERSYTILEPSIKHSECKDQLHVLLVEWIFIQYMHYEII